MLKLLSKVLVVAAMIFALIGQTLANTMMTCEISVELLQPHLNTEHSLMKHHEGMNHSEMLKQTNHSKCCGEVCFCPENACNSMTILSASHYTVYLARQSQVVVYHLTGFPKSNHSTLFRPPILA